MNRILIEIGVGEREPMTNYKNIPMVTSSSPSIWIEHIWCEAIWREAIMKFNYYVNIIYLFK